MYKYTAKYTDYNGVEREEVLYFNISKAEALRRETTRGEGGSYSELIQRIIKSPDINKIYKEFESLIADSYGEKSPDGKHFRKSKEITEAFMQSPAYDVFMMHLLTDENAPAEFVNNVLPDLSELDIPVPNKNNA